MLQKWNYQVEMLLMNKKQLQRNIPIESLSGYTLRELQDKLVDLVDQYGTDTQIYITADYEGNVETEVIFCSEETDQEYSQRIEYEIQKAEEARQRTLDLEKLKILKVGMKVKPISHAFYDIPDNHVDVIDGVYLDYRNKLWGWYLKDIQSRDGGRYFFLPSQLEFIDE